ncbi:MAG TPA: VOC family protein [Polyangia bacterium]|nr:VOC family protein [Polyangia bacterium]
MTSRDGAPPPPPAAAPPTPAAARGFHHLAIQVRDLASAERFYREVLGLPVLRRWPAADGAGERSVWLDAGDGHGFLALEVVAGGPTAAEDDGRAARPGLHLVALRIARDGRDAWEARLAAAGVTVEARTAFTLYVRDPEGNRVGLSHWPQAAGA